jgi:hypothetical protein
MKRSEPHATCDRRRVPLSSEIFLAFDQSSIPYRDDPHPREQEVVLSGLLGSGLKDLETSLFKATSGNIVSAMGRLLLTQPVRRCRSKWGSPLIGQKRPFRRLEYWRNRDTC